MCRAHTTTQPHDHTQQLLLFTLRCTICYLINDGHTPLTQLTDPEQQGDRLGSRRRRIPLRPSRRGAQPLEAWDVVNP